MRRDDDDDDVNDDAIGKAGEGVLSDGDVELLHEQPLALRTQLLSAVTFPDETTGAATSGMRFVVTDWLVPSR